MESHADRDKVDGAGIKCGMGLLGGGVKEGESGGGGGGEIGFGRADVGGASVRDDHVGEERCEARGKRAGTFGEKKKKRKFSIKN